MSPVRTVLHSAEVHLSSSESMWIQGLQLPDKPVPCTHSFLLQTQGWSHVNKPSHWSLVDGAIETDRLEGSGCSLACLPLDLTFQRNEDRV